MTPSTGKSCVDLDVTGYRATITLNRPERRNATNWQLFMELGECLEQVYASSELRVLVLTGSGKDFCVGGDLSADPKTRVMKTETLIEDQSRLRAVSQVAERLFHLPIPSIAHINGACAGVGLSLALATDLRIASTSAVFNTAFIGAGLSGDFGMGWLLTHAVGPAQAKQLLLMPGKLQADVAASLGLVHCASSESGNVVAAWCQRIEDSPPLAVRFAKQNLNTALNTDFGTYLLSEADRVSVCAHSKDAKEAASAFLEKRQPEFTGQ